MSLSLIPAMDTALGKPREVFHLDPDSGGCESRLCASLSLTSSTWAALSDGTGRLLLLRTGQRGAASHQWEVSGRGRLTPVGGQWEGPPHTSGRSVGGVASHQWEVSGRGRLTPVGGQWEGSPHTSGMSVGGVASHRWDVSGRGRLTPVGCQWEGSPHTSGMSVGGVASHQWEVSGRGRLTPVGGVHCRVGVKGFTALRGVNMSLYSSGLS
uniref:Uncharacterized protein n=1 Tax=Knipowitschia caucasica TaxID=637954 RepID=A0AAV2JZY3_KNICA